MTTISFKLPYGLLDRLQKESKARGISKSELVRESIEEKLAPRGRKASTLYDLGRKYVGAVKGGPRDLATNPKYMAGFGQ